MSTELDEAEIRGREIRGIWAYRDFSRAHVLLDRLQDRTRYEYLSLWEYDIDNSTSNAEESLRALVDFRSPSADAAVQDLFFEPESPFQVRLLAGQYLVLADLLPANKMLSTLPSKHSEEQLQTLHFTLRMLSFRKDVRDLCVEMASNPSTRFSFNDDVDRMIRQQRWMGSKHIIHYNWLSWCAINFNELSSTEQQSTDGRKLVDEYWKIVDRLIEDGMTAPIQGHNSVLMGQKYSPTYRQFLVKTLKQKGIRGWFARLRLAATGK